MDQRYGQLLRKLDRLEFLHNHNLPLDVSQPTFVLYIYILVT